jgi:ubiquinone/menaquinone biosynthesis C-methylase UbiE
MFCSFGRVASTLLVVALRVIGAEHPSAFGKAVTDPPLCALISAMPDVYSIITEVDSTVVARVADAMETSAADPQHRAMVAAYLADLELAGGARLLEIGCGTGAIARVLAAWPGVGEVLGIDPSPILLTRARELSEGIPNLSFEEGDGRHLALPDTAFDAVVLHRVLSHVPEPAAVLAQAFRLLRAGGRLAVFDGDYATITLATGDDDPLQTCVDAFRPAYITDPWLVRRLPGMVREAGFTAGRLRSHGYVQVEEPDYMLSIADRGADTLLAAGTIGPELAAALKAEARRRAAAHAFYGHVAYASLTARRPAPAASSPGPPATPTSPPR